MLIAGGQTLRAAGPAHGQAETQALSLPYRWAGRYTHVVTADNKPGEVALLIKVKSALIAEPRLKPFSLEVGVLGTVVTLYGQVDTVEHKSIADQIARSVHGVEQVESGIAVVARA